MIQHSICSYIHRRTESKVWNRYCMDTQVSINRKLKKKVIHTYNEILFRLEKEGNSDTDKP